MSTNVKRRHVLAVILLAFAASGAAIGNPPRSPDSSPTNFASSTHLEAKATMSPTFYGFNSPLSFAPVMTFLNASAIGGTPPYRFAWDFGDGGTSGTQNATHTYRLPGTYVAVLTVTDNGGITATSTVVATPIGSDGVHWVVARVTPALGPAPLSVGFAVTEMSALPRSYEWSLGDGVSSNAASPNRTYALPGTYVARLTATDPDGVNATYAMTIVVIGSGPPEVLATAGVAIYCHADVPDRVSFNGLVGGGTPPYTYSWQFGDGNGTTTTRAPVYVYNAFGFHTADVTVEDASGLRATSSVSLALAPPPCPPPGQPLWFVISLIGALVGVAVVTIGVVLALRRGRRKRGSPPDSP
jgi:PKD repeat protein